MTSLNAQEIAKGLRTLESVALIPRVTSTNAIARRVVSECLENELFLPRAIIVAGEQTDGQGRNARTWSSPAGKGIYTTTLITRTAEELALVPLHTAIVVASFLRETFDVDARVKWPNDILVGGRKIAGILIEARRQEDRAYLLIGIGINVDPVSDPSRPNAVAISEVSRRDFGGVANATRAFIEHIDAHVAEPLVRESVLAEWRALSVHRNGDRVQCDIGPRVIVGTWNGIDDLGRALIREGAETTAISAGDLLII
ncbi:MAG: biotin--[acetyl-CoA-carboxylase] ligase [Thermoanaerobaculia bacterium]